MNNRKLIAIMKNKVSSKQLHRFLLFDFIVLFIAFYWSMLTYPSLDGMYIYEFFMVQLVSWMMLNKLFTTAAGLPPSKVVLLISISAWKFGLLSLIPLALTFNLVTYVAETYYPNVNRLFIGSIYMLIFVGAAYFFFFQIIRFIEQYKDC